MASTAVIKLWATVKDNAGRIAKTAIQLALTEWNPVGTLPAAWKAIISHLIGTTTSIVKMSTSDSEAFTAAPVVAPRGTREDKVTVDLPDTNGVTHTFRLPTPLVALAVAPGSDRLDLTNTLLLAWVSAMTSHAVTSDGVNFAGTVTGGKFIRHKSEKKGGY